MRSLPEDRYRCRCEFGKALVFQCVYFCVGYYLVPLPVPKYFTLGQRLVYTIRCELFSLFTVLVCVLEIIKKRYSTTAMDPVRGRGSDHLVEVKVRLLQNTCEQLFLHFVAMLILCTFLDNRSMKAIPILVSLFVIGRIVYKIGYEISPMKRQFGFGVTFLPTLSTYIYCMFCTISYGLDYDFALWRTYNYDVDINLFLLLFYLYKSY